MESIRIPFIKDLSKADDSQFLLKMEENGARIPICSNNWPEQFPYAPVCGGSVALTEGAIAVSFHVRGLDLRAMNTEDNMFQFQDSCCEFFVMDPSGLKYYNFEVNCLGKILAASGDGRKDRVKRPSSEMERIRRICQIKDEVQPSPFDLEGEIFTWDVALLIPLDLIGIDPDNLPEALKANFYKCGDMTSHPHYTSWSPIETPKPDFHRPEFFGELILPR